MIRLLLTGFEPFGDHAINPSWEAIRELGGREGSIERRVALLPVDYEGVDERLPALINEGPWDLALHLGVTGESGALCLETRARRGPYSKPDNRGRVPADALAPAGAAEQLSSGVDVPSLLAFLEAEGAPARSSTDAGLYLCEYTYYRSLTLHEGSGAAVLFLHVPRFDEPFSRAELTDIVAKLTQQIALMMRGPPARQ